MRARAAIVLRAPAVAWGVGLLVAALIDVPGGGWLGLRPVLEPLLAGVLVPCGSRRCGRSFALGVLLPATVALVATARGFEERAHAARARSRRRRR